MTASLFAVIVVEIAIRRRSSGKRSATGKLGKVGQRMEKAPKEITTEEIIVSLQESVDEVREEIKKVPSRLRQALRRLAAVW